MAGDQEPSPESALAESAKTWGQFAAMYQAFMLLAWQEAILSPPRIQEAVVNALKLWRLPTHPEQEEAIKSLENLNTRLAELTAKVEALEKQWAHGRCPQETLKGCTPT
jgi:Lon protease-like protein